MIAVRPSSARLHTRAGWLDSRHTFSFGEHYDPRYMGFGALRVINEDRVAPGQGFGTHPHRDIEIVTYVLDGALRHGDSMGIGSIVKPGDVQRMTAGTGVLHSEMNASDTEPVHFLQIWIMPERARLAPCYEQRTFAEEPRRGRLTLLASRDGRQGSVTIHQDVDLYSAVLPVEQGIAHPLARSRRAWAQVVRGALKLNGLVLEAGDGAAITDEATVEVVATTSAEVLLIELA